MLRSTQGRGAKSFLERFCVFKLVCGPLDTMRKSRESSNACGRVCKLGLQLASIQGACMVIKRRFGSPMPAPIAHIARNRQQEGSDGGPRARGTRAFICMN